MCELAVPGDVTDRIAVSWWYSLCSCVLVVLRHGCEATCLQTSNEWVKAMERFEIAERDTSGLLKGLKTLGSLTGMSVHGTVALHEPQVECTRQTN